MFEISFIGELRRPLTVLNIGLLTNVPIVLLEVVPVLRRRIIVAIPQAILIGT